MTTEIPAIPTLTPAMRGHTRTDGPPLGVMRTGVVEEEVEVEEVEEVAVAVVVGGLR